MMRVYFMSFLFLCFITKAQTEVFKNNPHYKEHIGIKESFLGSEDDFMVCYPKSHRSLFATIFGLGFMTLIAITYALVTKVKSHEKLSFLYKQNAERNKDLTDSINYAVRIQNAILPGLPNSFNINNCLIYYKPKDIVSGDTYWVDEIDRFKIFIMADCTGHGVPGALLTMLVNSSIQKTLFENKLLNPGDILDTINDQIKTSLKQTKNSVMQDSIDMSVAVLNNNTNELQFAGANSHLYTIQNNKIKLYKGSKCTIGSVQAHVIDKPNTISIQLKEHDAFILYTDGVVDQIGGIHDEKLKRSGFQTMIQKALEGSFLNSLCSNLDNWKLNQEQVDDITLIAFKI